jgi:ribosome-associated heat shock protein Hsp15
VQVTALSELRRGAPEAALLYEETAASQALRKQRAESRKVAAAGFVPGKHKPSKKERRQLTKFRTAD